MKRTRNHPLNLDNAIAAAVVQLARAAREDMGI